MFVRIYIYIYGECISLETNMAKYLGVDKIYNLWNIIRANGGILNSIYTLFRLL